MLVLGIESSCDETAAALVSDGRQVRSSAVASQAERHARFGGVVPELASRAHVESLLPTIERALSGAGADLSDI
ncbi:MAG: tRNA (adenosine(37)-N6)-threonylcarbamoyltransferase complex transferase subunit TsaD, partial [Planctomycetota bacterium]